MGGGGGLLWCWIMVVFIMAHVQVLVGRVDLIVNVVMANNEYLEDLSTGKLIQT